MKPVGQFREIVRAEQLQPVEVEEGGVIRRARLDDLSQDLANRTQGERRFEEVRCRARRSAPLAGLRVGDGRAWCVFVHRAEDRRDHENRGSRSAIADRVEEAVHGGNERAPLHGVSTDDVDADLEAEQVGIGIPHRPSGERIEVRVRGEAEIGDIETELVGSSDRPHAARCRRLDAMTDRAAVVPPAQLVERLGGLKRRIGAHIADLDGVGLRQPHHDTPLLNPRSAELESDDGGLALHESRSAGLRQMQFGSTGHSGIVDRLAVDRRREHRPPHVLGNPGQVQAGGLHGQLDPRGRGPELAAHTRGLLRGDPHPVGVGLRPGAGGQPQRRQAGRR